MAEHEKDLAAASKKLKFVSDRLNHGLDRTPAWDVLQMLAEVSTLLMFAIRNGIETRAERLEGGRRLRERVDALEKRIAALEAK